MADAVLEAGHVIDRLLLIQNANHKMLCLSVADAMVGHVSSNLDRDCSGEGGSRFVFGYIIFRGCQVRFLMWLGLIKVAVLSSPLLDVAGVENGSSSNDADG